MHVDDSKRTILSDYNLLYLYVLDMNHTYETNQSFSFVFVIGFTFLDFLPSSGSSGFVMVWGGISLVNDS